MSEAVVMSEKPNPYGIGAGDRVTFTDGMPVFDSFGAVIGRINVEVRCVVEDVQFDSTFPDGIAVVAIDPTSIPDQCIDPLQAGSRHRKPGRLALVRLSLVRPDRALVS